jgi:hypothetical protein
MMYVYRTNGTKQVVVPGEMNDNFRIIEQGLDQGDEIYLSLPKGAETFKLVGVEYLEVLKQRVQDKKDEEEKQKKAVEEQEKKKHEMMQQMQEQGPGQGPGQGRQRRRNN